VNFYSCAAIYQVSLSAHRESFVCAAITSAHRNCEVHTAQDYSAMQLLYIHYNLQNTVLYIQRERESRKGEGADVHLLGRVSVLCSCFSYSHKLKIGTVRETDTAVFTQT
jgi:hypothetical protein